MLRSVGFPLLLLLFGVRCAGPATPFGAIDALKAKGTELAAELKLIDAQPAMISFKPKRQVLHAATRFEVVIQDSKQIPKDFRFQILYNGQDLTGRFYAQAQREDLGPNQIKFTTKHFRLPAGRDHTIVARYWRNLNEKPVESVLAAPTCLTEANSQSLAAVTDFFPPRSVVHLINFHSQRAGVNPFFVAGLIAQESAFDPAAVSRSHALGLTQITSSAQAEVLKDRPTWPRYEGLEELPTPVLKWFISNGNINAQNEWRLNPSLSIQGGLDYLSYLKSYWSRSDKLQLLESRLGMNQDLLTQILLASYNSGASRVADAIERNGPTWLNDEELREARKYVRRVVSYCDHFSEGEEL